MILRVASWLLAAVLLAMAPTAATFAAIGCAVPTGQSAAMQDDCAGSVNTLVCADTCAAVCHGVLTDSAAAPRTSDYGMPPPATESATAMRPLSGPEPPPPRSVS